MPSVIDRLRKESFHYRNKKRLSQDELADKIGIIKNYLSKIEAPSSTKAFSLDVLFAIADGLEVDIVQFFLPIEERK